MRVGIVKKNPKRWGGGFQKRNLSISWFRNGKHHLLGFSLFSLYPPNMDVVVRSNRVRKGSEGVVLSSVRVEELEELEELDLRASSPFDQKEPEEAVWIVHGRQNPD